MSLSIEFGFINLLLLLSSDRVDVHAQDGRLLFTAAGEGRIAPFDLKATEAALPWEDTQTIRLGLSRSISEARGLPVSDRILASTKKDAGSAFFLPRARAVRGVASVEE